MAEIDRAAVVNLLTAALDSYRRGHSSENYLGGVVGAAHYLMLVNVAEVDVYYKLIKEYVPEHKANEGNPLKPASKGRLALLENLRLRLDAARVADK